MEKIKQLVKRRLESDEHRLLTAAVMLVLGFVSGFGKILGFPSNTAVALAAVFGENIIPIFAGSVLSYAVNGNLSSGVVSLCAMLVIAGLRCIFPQNRFGIFTKRSEPLLTSLVTCAVLILFGCVMSVASPADAFTTSMRMVSALLCGCTVFAAMNVIQSRASGGSFELGGLNSIYIGMLYVMAVSVLASLPTGVINIGRAAGCFCMLLAVRRYRQTGGAVVGALTTCAVLICAPMLARNTLLLATSGLICGVFYPLGITLTVLVFLGVSLISLVAVGTGPDTFPMFADILLGSLAFIAVPMPAVKKLTKRISGLKSPVDIVSQTTSSKLSFASSAIGEIRSQLTQVTAAMQRRARRTDIGDMVIKAVCSECEHRNKCFENRQQLMWSLGKLGHISARCNCISEDDVLQQLPMCRRSRHMTEVFNRTYSFMVTEKANDMRISEMRDLLCEQLGSMQDILRDLSFRVGQVRSIDAALSSQVRSCFDALGYPNAKVCVYVDDRLCQRVDVYLTADFDADAVRVTSMVSSAVGCDLDLPAAVKTDSLTRLSFCEIPSFLIETAVFTASRGNEYSGDSYDIFDLSAAEKYIVLSDGMGTGKRARLDSVFSVSLVSRLIRCGMSVTTAQRMVNSMMRVKGWEESFATLDILRLDLYGGSASLLKSGAAASYLCRDGGLKVFSSDAFPAGILPECRPDTAELKLFDGDIIMLASDGVDPQAARKLASLSAKGIELEKICSRLGEFCMDLCKGEPDDDVTIILAKIVKKRTKC